MRRFLRRLCLLLSLGAVIGTPLSFLRMAYVARARPHAYQLLVVSDGYVCFYDQRGPGTATFYAFVGQTPGRWAGGIGRPDRRVYSTDRRLDWVYALRPGLWKLDLKMRTASTSKPLTRRTVVMPLWVPAVLFSLPFLPRLVRRIRTRVKPGVCQACGYDLRATPDRCPECGRVPAMGAPPTLLE
jgi:hypothetical protein